MIRRRPRRSASMNDHHWWLTVAEGRGGILQGRHLRLKNLKKNQEILTQWDVIIKIPSVVFKNKLQKNRQQSACDMWFGVSLSRHVSHKHHGVGQITKIVALWGVPTRTLDSGGTEPHIATVDWSQLMLRVAYHNSYCWCSLIGYYYPAYHWRRQLCGTGARAASTSSSNFFNSLRSSTKSTAANSIWFPSYSLSLWKRVKSATRGINIILLLRRYPSPLSRPRRGYPPHYAPNGRLQRLSLNASVRAPLAPNPGDTTAACQRSGRSRLSFLLLSVSVCVCVSASPHNSW